MPRLYSFEKASVSEQFVKFSEIFEMNLLKSLSEIKFSGIGIEPVWELVLFGGAILPISGVLFTNFLLKCGWQQRIQEF